MDWAAIMELRRWTGLRATLSDAEEALPGIYRAGHDAYVQTQPYDVAFRRGLPEAPFITLAYWAPNLIALERATKRDAAATVPRPWLPPPPALLLGTPGTYGELLRAASAGGEASERGVYSGEGKFVHKILKTGRFTFCFLDAAIDAGEPVYCIEVGLS